MAQSFSQGRGEGQALKHSRWGLVCCGLEIRASDTAESLALGKDGEGPPALPLFPCHRTQRFVLLALGRRASHTTKPLTCGLRLPVQGLLWPHSLYSYLCWLLTSE